MSMSVSKKLDHRTLHWFRKGLRLHDNPSLLNACETSSQIWPVYFVNPELITHGENIGFNRWRFLLESLQDLDNQLRKFQSRLIVIQADNVKEILLHYVKEWKITKLTFEVETEPHRMERDNDITNCLQEMGVEVVSCHSHNLYILNEVIEKNHGVPPLTYQKFLTTIKSLGQPKKPVACLTASHFQSCNTPLEKCDDKLFELPTLEDLKLFGRDGVCNESKFPGGESVALQRMEDYLKNEGWINSFEKPKTSPNSLEPSTTVLSPYITFGCLSAKTFYWKLSDVYQRARCHSSPPVSLHGQLLWREFFYTVASVTPQFDKMEGNDVCLQVPWDDNKEYLKAWSEGRTGYPFIDAIMTQLRAEGWIHHLARHAVACFLTRGDLWLSWEHGLKVFETYLLDHDWSLNAGNWLWLSASAFFQAYFRIYSPVVFGKKTDPNGDFIRKYLPCLAKYPREYIFEPWQAPLAVQKKCACIVGKDYPRPIVNHDLVRPRNIERMKLARKEKYANETSNKKAERTSPGKRSKNSKEFISKKRKQTKITSQLNVKKEGESS